MKNGKEKINRRRFLKTASSLAVAGPAVLPSSVALAGKGTGPNDRITLGFIGVGKQSRGHLGSFLNRSETQVLAVCEVDGTRREDARKMVEDHYGDERGKGSYKGCAAYTDFRELLARKDIDAVVIGTPDHWHAIPINMAVKAGKDIYCEKPLTLTLKESKVVMDIVSKHDCVFQTGSQQRSSDNFRRACELVRNGRIGKVKTVHVAVGGPSEWCDLGTEEKPKGLDWDMWLGPAPWRGYHSVLSPRGVHDHFPRWRAYREYSGGGMTDWGAHHFDIAQWGLGMDRSGPVEIFPPNGDDRELLTFKYANGVEMYHTSDGNGVTFTGTDGKIFVNRGTLEVSPKSIAEEPLGPDAVRLYDSNDHRGNWVDCIRTRKAPICDVEIGARSVSVCHLGNLAYWYNRPLKWDPEGQHFVDDAEANTRWMDVNRRDPWHLYMEV